MLADAADRAEQPSQRINGADDKPHDLFHGPLARTMRLGHPPILSAIPGSLSCRGAGTAIRHVHRIDPLAAGFRSEKAASHRTVYLGICLQARS